MALPITSRIRSALTKVNIEPNLILELQGFTERFGAITVKRFWRIGDDGLVIGAPNLFIGGSIVDENSRNYVSFSGTSKSINQQLLQDKGGSTSVSSIKVELLDFNGELSKLFQPGEVVDDVLSIEAVFYINFEGGAHPEDSIILFNGIVDDIQFPTGTVVLNIAHPEQLKRQEVFLKVDTIIREAVDISQTTIPLEDATGFLLPVSGVLETYARIENEIIRYTGISGNDLTGCTRSQLTSLADSHDSEGECSSYYRLIGQGVDLALNLMLSGKGYAFPSNASSINFVNSSLTVDNSIFFFQKNLIQELGLVVGDRVSLSNSSDPLNNGSDYVITNIVLTNDGTYIVVNQNLITEVESTAIVSFKSRYDVLPDGCAMSSRQVDVIQHENYKRLFGGTFPEYDFYLKDTIKAKEFIESELYFPLGFYSIPRQGKCSVGITLPPLAIFETRILNESNITNADKIKITRSLSKYFYNAVVYRFNDDALEDKFRSGLITLDQSSINRIKVGTRPLTINSKGLRRSQLVGAFINSQSNKFLDRYRLAAEYLTVEMFFSEGFSIEVGDTVILEGELIQIYDIKRGDRNFNPRIMEVIDKKMDLTTGRVTLMLSDTAFNLDGRYGIISPSSLIGIGSTDSRLILKQSFFTGEFAIERDKYTDFVGLKYVCRSPDYSFEEEFILTGFDNSNDNAIFTSGLSVAPSENYVIELADYSDVDAQDQILAKRTFAWVCPTVEVTAQIDNVSFEAVTSSLWVGAIVRISSPDFTNDSQEAIIDSIVGNVITLDRVINYTPNIGDLINLVGFKDDGLPYRFI